MCHDKGPCFGGSPERFSEITLFQVPLIIDPKNKKGWLAYLTFGNVFRKGTWKSELSECVYEEKDHVVTGRYAFDAFSIV